MLLHGLSKFSTIYSENVENFEIEFDTRNKKTKNVDISLDKQKR